MRKRLAVLLACVSIPLCSVSTIAGAVEYPSEGRPITVVVPFAAGSGTDVITRTVLESMSRSMKANFVVDNKAGASGQIGTEFVSRAAPDGYTILVAGNSTHSSNPYIYKSVRYDPLKDFAPIGQLTLTPLALLTHAGSPFADVKELIQYGKENPGKLSYGYGNTGGQVSAGLLTQMGEISAQAISYKGTPQIFTDLLGERIHFAFVDFAASGPLMDSGRLRAIAMTGSQRYPQRQSVPAVNETAGFEDFSLLAWLGFVAPAGTPQEILNELNEHLNLALTDPTIKARLETTHGSIVVTSTPQDFAQFMTEQNALWRKQISLAGIQPQ